MEEQNETTAPETKDHFPEAGSEPVVLTEARNEEIRNTSTENLLTQRTSLKALAVRGPELEADLAGVENELFNVRGISRPEEGPAE